MNERILVVDDEESLRLSLKFKLKSAGFDVDVAADGEEALEKLKARPADAVLLDINMPRMSGIEALTIIRQKYPQTETIMLTGFADFSTATFTDCLFDTCSFPQASFFATTFFATTFKTCDLAYALFNESSSRGLGFPDCNLHGADLRLREARLPVDWRGANLWGVQVGIGCAFFNGMFDERQLRIFASFVARRGGILAPEVCGKELALVNRLMREQE